MQWVGIVCGCLFCVQVVEGTTIYIATLSSIFLIVASLSFNTVGGLTRPSGGFILFNAGLTLGAGLFVKAALGEPAQSNLQNPDLSFLVYVVGQICLLAAAVFSSRLRRQKGLLANTVTSINWRRVTLGCFVMGFVLSSLGELTDSGAGSFGRALGQLNRFIPIAILLGVYFRCKTTDGRSSFYLPSFLALLVQIFFGIISYSKESLLSGPVCWALAAMAAGYRISRVRLAVIVAVSGIVLFFIYPYSQYGRTQASEGLGRSVYLLTHPVETYELNKEHSDLEKAKLRSRSLLWFDSDAGFADRLNMIAIDDALINLTVTDHVHGMIYIWYDFLNIIPHVILPDKPDIVWGNIYAHELGILAADDHTTGVSFSPVADAFHEGTWFAVLILMPAMALMCFTVIDSVAGDIREGPWGLYFLLVAAHQAPEGTMGAFVIMSTYAVEVISFAAFASAYISPLIATFFVGPEKKVLREVAPVRIIRKRPGMVIRG